jgi:hypothetical protein
MKAPPILTAPAVRARVKAPLAAGVKAAPVKIQVPAVKASIPAAPGVKARPVPAAPAVRARVKVPVKARVILPDPVNVLGVVCKKKLVVKKEQIDVGPAREVYVRARDTLPQLQGKAGKFNLKELLSLR